IESTVRSPKNSIAVAADFREPRYGPKRAFVVGNHARTVFVFPASETPSLVDVSEPDTGRGNRDHGSGYTAAIHVLDGSRRCVRLPGLVTLSLLRIHHRDPCG